MSQQIFISSITEGLKSGHTTITALQEEELRKTYVEMFNTDAETAVEKLTVFAKEAIQNIQEEMKQFEVPSDGLEETFTIACENKYEEIKVVDDIQVLTIGRKTGVSFHIVKDRSISRLHVILFILKKYRKVIVMDVGSANGIKMLTRDAGKDYINSFPNQREMIFLDFGEMTVFQIGSLKLAFNTRECIICLSKNRSVTFVCGKRPDGSEIYHFVCCDDCEKTLDKCPICRHPREKLPIRDEYFLVTCPQ